MAPSARGTRLEAAGHGRSRASASTQQNGTQPARVCSSIVMARSGGEVDELPSAVERHRDTVEVTGIAYHLDTTGLTEMVLSLSP
ncbi:hypothetical protein ACI2L1_41620 [Streptomyces sp. NPDC019531]|uniref:hypothetical protein n=1 Tax=Streptomyces sp. NPDC019531 TaxID=3365062 RepID=UPI00384C5153